MMADEDPIDASRFRTMLPKPKADPVEQIDEERFRGLAGQPGEETPVPPLFALDEEEVRRRAAAELVRLRESARRYGLGQEELTEEEARRYVERIMRFERLSEILQYEDADGFDTRLDDVVRRFRERYPLPIIVKAGRSDGYDRPERPAASFFVFDAPIPRMAGMDTTREEQVLDDFLFACIRQAERDAQTALFDAVSKIADLDPDPEGGPSFEVGTRSFFPPAESLPMMQRLLRAEAEGRCGKLRKYGEAAGRRSILPVPDLKEQRQTESDEERRGIGRAIQQREEAYVEESARRRFRQENADAALRRYADDLQQDIRDYAARDAERKQRTFGCGACEVTVGRNEDGGYYAFVRCDECDWTSGAVYVARTPEENTPERAKQRGTEIAKKHNLYHLNEADNDALRRKNEEDLF